MNDPIRLACTTELWHAPVTSYTLRPDNSTWKILLKSHQCVRKSSDDAFNLGIRITSRAEILNQPSSTVVAEGTVTDKNNPTTKVFLQPSVEICHGLFYIVLNIF